MSVVLKKELEVDSRAIMQNATLAVRDIYDAIVELVTNADDRYQILSRKNRVEIGILRRRGQPSVLIVRDFADGMTAETMKVKLSRIGGRVSGMEQGLAVRGTNSRGAKDVAALGDVTFESIAEDGRLHKCRISKFFDFELYESRGVTEKDRNRLGIHQGTGTSVTVSIDPRFRVPNHRDFTKKVTTLVPLRDIVQQKNTKIVVSDLQHNREDEITLPSFSGKKRLSERFFVPGYPDMEAKLVIYRAQQPFKRDTPRFRLGGLLIKSKHAIHESTLFDPELEKDPCAAWFYGRLTCEAIDDLWNEFDNRHSSKQPPLDSNPIPILDPSRRSGLTREHPVVRSLYKEALKRLRPLVEVERRREQNERSRVESSETRKRLTALEKVANKFIEQHTDEDEDDTSRDQSGIEKGSRFRIQGFALSPPYLKIVVGHSRQCHLSVRQEVFPEVEAGDSVQLKCLTPELGVDRPFVPLKSHPSQEGVLRASWSVTALQRTNVTGLRAQVGSIIAETMIEILGSEAEQYTDIQTLQFQKKRYRVSGRNRKRVRLLAPLSIVDSFGNEFEFEMKGAGYRVTGSSKLVTKVRLGVAMADLSVSATRDNNNSGKLRAYLGSHIAETDIVVASPIGASISIKLEDVTFGAQRYRWKKNVLEIAARHASLSRYLGSKSEQFPGQEKSHFRVLLAEIVADAVCPEVLRHRIQSNPTDYENADWDLYYAEFSELMDKFLPGAHQLVVPDTD